MTLMLIITFNAFSYYLIIDIVINLVTRNYNEFGTAFLALEFQFEPCRIFNVYVWQSLGVN